MSATELIARLPADQLGGARVFRPCTIAGRAYRSNEVIGPEVLRRIPRQNLRALMDQRFIVAWPVGENPARDEVISEVHVVPRAGANNRFDVIVGTRLNSAPLSKIDADRLAAAQRRPEELVETAAA